MKRDLNWLFWSRLTDAMADKAGPLQNPTPEAMELANKIESRPYVDMASAAFLIDAYTAPIEGDRDHYKKCWELERKAREIAETELFRLRSGKKR